MDLDEDYSQIFGPSAADDTVAGMQHIVFLPADRPDVEVLVDDVWCPGELCMWTQRPDGSWWGNAQWRREAGATFLGSFPAEQLRQI